MLFFLPIRRTCLAVFRPFLNPLAFPLTCHDVYIFLMFTSKAWHLFRMFYSNTILNTLWHDSRISSGKNLITTNPLHIQNDTDSPCTKNFVLWREEHWLGRSNWLKCQVTLHIQFTDHFWSITVDLDSCTGRRSTLSPIFYCNQFGEFPLPAWAVASCSSGPHAGGTPQIDCTEYGTQGAAPPCNHS